MSDRYRPWRLALALTGSVVALDQGIKALVDAEIAAGDEIGLLPFLDLTNSRNTGVAFGLGGGLGDWILVGSVAALVVIGVLFSRESERPLGWLAVGLLAGGALGNLADRVRTDAVTDYVDLSFWPAFNLADVAIVAGVGLVALAYLREGPG